MITDNDARLQTGTVASRTIVPADILFHVFREVPNLNIAVLVAAGAVEHLVQDRSK